MTEKILISEDESITSLHLRALLIGWGFEVVATVDTAEDAVNLIEADPPDLVLMDIRLKGDMDGIEAAELIHDQYGIPVVFLSAHNDESTRFRVKQSPASGLVIKPFEDRELYVAVKAALHRRRIERALAEGAEGPPPELNQIGDAVMATDEEGRIVFMNERAERLTGWEDVDAFEHEATDIIRLTLAEDGSLIEHPVSSILKEARGRSGQIDSILTAKSGSQHPVSHQITAIRDQSGDSVGAIITLRRRRQPVWVDAGNLDDPRLDAPTRFVTPDLLTEYLEVATTRAHSRHTMVGIFLVYLDPYGDIAVSLSSEATAALFTEAAVRLQSSVRVSDSVARIRQDTFVVIQPDLEYAEGAVILGEKLVRIFEDPFTLDDRQVASAACVGAALYPVDSEEPKLLLRCAEEASDQARANGRAQLRFYSGKIDSVVAQERDLGDDLEGAIEAQQLELLFQPVFDLSSGAVVGLESRIQWHHPERGLLPAEAFLPAAERYGTLSSITDWTIREALSRGAALQRLSPGIRVSVALAGSEIRRRGLPSQLLKILKDTGLETRYLDLELSEDVLVTNPPLTTHLNLQRLSQLGVNLTLAKFGFSHASMVSLKKAPMRKIKIDGSLVGLVAHEKETQAIVRAIIDLARSTGLEIAADKIEDAYQWRWLRYNGCEIGQGEYLAGFMTRQELFEMLVKRQR